MEDSTPDIEQEQVEEAPDNTENKENLEKVVILQLMQKYGVGKAQLYDQPLYRYHTIDFDSWRRVYGSPIHWTRDE